MKKLLLLIAITSCSFNLRSQFITEDIIGETKYFFQYYYSSANNIFLNTDGTISAVWKFSPDANSNPNPPYPFLGTGYNYFDNSVWDSIPHNRIDGRRTVFPNVLVTSTGKEITFSHSLINGGYSDIYSNYRSQKGTGTWQHQDNILGTFYTDYWPKACVGGANGQTIHLINNTFADTSHNIVCQPGGRIVYSRSLDEGLTWTINKEVIPLIDSTHYIGFRDDAYAIDAHGNTVAILIGSLKTDLILLKSIDNGNSWNATIVDSFPFRNFSCDLTDINNDGIADTIDAVNGDLSLVIDQNDICHVAFIKTRISIDPINSIYYSSERYDSLYYWNESYGPDNYVSIANAIDYNNNGIIQINGLTYPDDGNIRRPSITIDSTGRIFVLYEAADERTTNSNYFTLMHPYFVCSFNSGLNWSPPFEILPALTTTGLAIGSTEGRFLSCSKVCDNFVHFLYFRDTLHVPILPGPNFQEVVYGKIDIHAIASGLIKIDNPNYNISIFPNPSNEGINFLCNENCNLEILDSRGRLIDRLQVEKKSNTTYHRNLAEGIYFARFLFDDKFVVRKFVVM